ncbi:MAG: helix-turn-helix domain-containing protein [Clostridia bacterium]|nr:helix-turn-helix domain-containing protein [Clostridia bacterium]
MGKIRVHKTNDYTVMSNNHFRNKELSLKAKGLLSLMLSLPDDWDYSIAGLSTLSKDGKASVAEGLEELKRLGYLLVIPIKSPQGRFAGYDYEVYENPYPENPYPENPYPENPYPENPPQLNTNTLSTNKLSTNEIKERKKEKKRKGKNTGVRMSAGAGAREGMPDFAKMTDEDLSAWGRTNPSTHEAFEAWLAETERRRADGGLDKLKSHAEVLTDFGVSEGLCAIMKEFLRHCYANGHLVTNAKLEDILFRLFEEYESDEARVTAVQRAIGGGYFDVRTGGERCGRR